MRRNLRLASVLLALLAASGCGATRWLPQDLERVAEGLSCGPVEGYFDRPGPVLPPYAYLSRDVAPGDDDVAVFWCQRRQTKEYLLVFTKQGKLYSDQCPGFVKWENYPRGLSLSTETGLSLADFSRVGDPQRRGPEGKKTVGPLVSDYYDGIQNLFYCDGGTWLVRMRD